MSDAIEIAYRQKMMLRKNLIKAGFLLLLTFGFLMMGLYVLHQSQMIKAWKFPVGSIATFLIGGGLACFVLLFPESGGSKGKQLLPASKVFNSLGYHALLVDFRGVGGSSGNTTTIGANEAEDVAWVMKAVRQKNLQPLIILYGVSMGSAAILRAIAHYDIVPDAIILELPFVRLLDAVRSRLREFKFPPFPFAELLVFWGGIQHGFDGFSHNPITYVEQVKCPVLIFHGQQDKWTSIKEVNGLFQKIRTPKQLVIFQDSGHQLLVTVDEILWQKSITHFLEVVGGGNPT